MFVSDHALRLSIVDSTFTHHASFFPKLHMRWPAIKPLITSMMPLHSETKCLGANSTNFSILYLLFYLAAAILSMLTLLTHIAQIINMPFDLYYRTGLGAIVVVITSWFIIFGIQAKRICFHNMGNLFLLLALGLACSVISLILHRPDADDYYYIPNAIFYVQNRDALMGYRIHYLFSSKQLFSFSWATSNPYEYLNALIAVGFCLDFLSVYYLIMPGISGFMIPIAIFLAIVHFSDDERSSIVGTLLTVFVLLLLGETHRTFGNFSFVRIFQGKSILLSIGVPLFIGFSIKYFKNPSLLTWTGLLFVSTALLGVSSSTVFILPALAFVLSLSYMRVNINKWKLHTFFLYFASLIYVMMVALYIFIFWRTDIDNTSPANRGWPTTFLGHAEFFINHHMPLTPLLTFGSTFLIFLLLRGERRKFLVTWVVVSIVVFLNPISSSFLIENVTSANAYWRMFYIYPFPIIVGILSSNLFTLIKHLSLRNRLYLSFFISILLFGILFLSPTSVFRQANIYIGIPTYKLPIKYFNQAKEIAKIAPPGVMIAPAPIGGLIAIIDSRFPQIRVREDAELTWLSEDEAHLRIEASNYVGGEGNDFLSFQRLLSIHSENVRSIVIKKDLLDNNAECKELLAVFGFTNRNDTDEYAVVWKP